MIIEKNIPIEVEADKIDFVAVRKHIKDNYPKEDAQISFYEAVDGQLYLKFTHVESSGTKIEGAALAVKAFIEKTYG